MKDLNDRPLLKIIIMGIIAAMGIIGLIMIFTGCKKDGGCEKWMCGFEYEGYCGHDNSAPFSENICDKIELSDAHSGKKIVIGQFDNCIAYKVYYRQL